VRATLEGVDEGGEGLLAFADPDGGERAMALAGYPPLPPYIRRREEEALRRRRADRSRYQTVFARQPGSVAAPTAGLHFTPPLFEALAARGVEVVKLVLHVGVGTFKPVRAERVEDHRMDSERAVVGADVAAALNAALDEGRDVVAVGTTTVRTLETATGPDGRVGPLDGMTDLFIHPPYRFRFPYSGLLTNFHLPRSTLLMLVSAYAGRERVLAAYEDAKRRGYRFYSLGDAMLFQGGPVG
jgi:S-adenosylmethionine:tRNA ribosyltransferase-isomerase